MIQNNQKVEGKIITQNVKLLSFVSLFTDMASEMLVPISGLFLNVIGLNVFSIALLEGAVEAISGLLKPYFGALSDNIQKRLPFIQGGYFLSAISKPLMAASSFPPILFLVRSLDRVGKGMRTGARDAMLHEESQENTKATVFGYHRSMDTMGAVLGPLLALGFLALAHQGNTNDEENYKLLFIFAFVPGMMAVGLSLLLKENKHKKRINFVKTSLIDSFAYWKKSPIDYKKLLIGILAFALVNSTDQLLIIKMRQSGVSITMCIVNYIIFNSMFALLAFPLGKWADRIGFKKIIIFGLLAFALTYIGFAFKVPLYCYSFLMVLYGVYAAATDGVSKAWIGKIVNEEEVGLAIGTYGGLQSICAFIAGIIAGSFWMFSETLPSKNFVNISFLVSAFGALIIMIYFARTKITEYLNIKPIDKSFLEI